MTACAAIGDSIAVGVGQARPECVTTARVGITSITYINSLLPLAETSAETTIISLGVNDDVSVDTLTNLRFVRRQITSHTVYWLLPGLKDEVRADIQTVAGEHGDRLIDTRPWVGRDHLHPNGAGYQQIAMQSYGNGSPTNYPVQQFSPVEVAEAPARIRMPDESPFHVDYAQVPAQRATRTQQHELLYFYGRQPMHHLSSMATHRDRIRSQRELAQFESRSSRQGYSQLQVRTAEMMLHLPTPPHDEPARRHAYGRGPAVAVAYAPGPVHTAAAPRALPVHPVPTHGAPVHAAAPPSSHPSARTAQACASAKACAHSVRG